MSALNLVSNSAVVYAATNVTNNSNSTSGTTTSGAVALNMNWKAGVAIGALLASPFVLGMGF